MNSTYEPFGAIVYAELRKISGFDVMTVLLDYDSIQQMKQADRETAAKLLGKGNRAVIETILTQEPDEIARYLVEEAKRVKQQSLDAGLMLFD